MGRRLLIGLLFGVAVYAGIVLWIDFGSLRAALAQAPLWPVPAAMGLSLGNYLVRFVRWERYLRLLGIRVDRRTSLLIHLSGFSMGITPGKMGEVLKSWMLKRISGVRIHQSAPIVVAERVTDVLGILLLVVAGGIASHPELAWILWTTLAGCVALIVLVGSPAFARLVVRVLTPIPKLGRLAPRVEGAFASSRILLRPREIVLPTLLSTLAWSLECVGFWLLARAFVPDSVSFLFAVFAYAIGALAGAVVLVVPGGIGVTEWSVGSLLRSEYQAKAGLTLELARSNAAAAVLLVRLATLWFGVAVGLAALALFQRRHGRVTPE